MTPWQVFGLLRIYLTYFFNNCHIWGWNITVPTCHHFVLSHSPSHCVTEVIPEYSTASKHRFIFTKLISTNPGHVIQGNKTQDAPWPVAANECPVLHSGASFFPEYVRAKCSTCRNIQISNVIWMHEAVTLPRSLSAILAHLTYRMD